ncbi:hypothetical protein D478_16434 [Brevibacillus agri BAB-2500]|nr:hypothetical protein D478_16434 [Brevibacillus agri BAB-2500]
MTISYQKEGMVGVVTIDRPDVFNCLNLATLTELRQPCRRVGGRSQHARRGRDRSGRQGVLLGRGFEGAARHVA